MGHELGHYFADDTEVDEAQNEACSTPFANLRVFELPQSATRWYLAYPTLAEMVPRNSRISGKKSWKRLGGNKSWADSAFGKQ